VVIPQKSDAIARRKAKGSAGGRPLDFDVEDYKMRNVIERAFQQAQELARPGHPLRQHALIYRGGMSWHRSCSGCRDFQDTP